MSLENRLKNFWESFMSLENIIATGLLCWLVVGMVLMGLGVW